MFPALRVLSQSRNKTSMTLRFCVATPQDREIIGCREVVGFGKNGAASYVDRQDYPFPAIRFLADNPYLLALREKEKGDWRSLTIDEKKCLYRASFCQTYAEMGAPTGEWKSIIGCSLMLICVPIWFFLFLKTFVIRQELPETFSLERRQAQLKKMIDAQMNPIEGISSQWDYDKEDWKK